jgi:hypothetical protein
VHSRKKEKEKIAFVKFGEKISSLNPKAFAKPLGADSGFPDFGYSFEAQNKKYDIHIEYKADKTAQMGSMRDWVFDGNNFYTPDKNSNSKEELVFIMNKNQKTIQNAKNMLSVFKSVFGPNIKSIYSGMLSYIKNKEERKQKLKDFANKTDNYMLSKIENDELGDKILSHYIKKFEKAKRPTADHSILIMMIGNQLFLIKGEAPIELKRALGGEIPNLVGLKAKLEVRIQPRGLNSSSPARIDTMASFRLSGVSLKGLQI